MTIDFLLLLLDLGMLGGDTGPSLSSLEEMETFVEGSSDGMHESETGGVEDKEYDGVMVEIGDKEVSVIT